MFLSPPAAGMRHWAAEDVVWDARAMAVRARAPAARAARPARGFQEAASRRAPASCAAARRALRHRVPVVHKLTRARALRQAVSAPGASGGAPAKAVTTAVEELLEAQKAALPAAAACAAPPSPPGGSRARARSAKRPAPGTKTCQARACACSALLVLMLRTHMRTC